MAGYVTTIDKDGVKDDVSFHVDTSWKLKDAIIMAGGIDFVVEIQLDGDELNYVVNNFVNVPYSKTKRVQNWYGDLAKFIAENW